MVVIETPCLRIVYYCEYEVLLIKWLLKPDTAAFREAYLQLLELVTTNKVIKLYCTDLSAIGPLDREQEGWLNLEYYPMVYDMIKDNIFAAVVFSEEHFRAIITNYQVSAPLEQHRFLHFNYFTDLEEAIHWLDSLKRAGMQTYCPCPGSIIHLPVI